TERLFMALSAGAFGQVRNRPEQIRKRRPVLSEPGKKQNGCEDECAGRQRDKPGRYGVRRRVAAFRPGDMSPDPKARTCPRTPKPDDQSGDTECEEVDDGGFLGGEHQRGAEPGQNGGTDRMALQHAAAG